MANDLRRNPWIIDTPGAGVLYSSRIFVKQFQFMQYLNDTDNVVVQDKNGREVWAENGAADLETVRSGAVGAIEGLIVPTLVNGKLLIYIK